MRRFGLIAALGMTLLALGAQASSAQSFSVPAPERPHIWDFAMWCSALQGYPAERCEVQSEEDKDAYSAYVARASRFATRARVQTLARPRPDKKNESRLLLAVPIRLPRCPGAEALR